MHIFIQLFTNVPQLLLSFGYIGLFLFVFAESGLFFGFFLPGDTLLFTAGLLATQHIFSIIPVLLIIFLAAILGDSGYWFGSLIGCALFTREDSHFFHKKHALRAHQFYDRYGVYAIVLARFIPVVRTFTPIVAGVGNMSYRLFLPYNIVGGIVWGASITLLGYFLGSIFPGIAHYFIVIALVIAVCSLVPLFLIRRDSKH